MHATGLMEDGIGIVIENLVCQRTRPSYGTLGRPPALNSPGLYFVFKCSIHLSHSCSPGFCAQNSDKPVRYQNMNEVCGGLKQLPAVMTGSL